MNHAVIQEANEIIKEYIDDKVEEELVLSELKELYICLKSS